MTAARQPQYKTEDDVIADVRLLRQGYQPHGKWTLAQICWHIGLPLRANLKPPEPMDVAPTPEQAATKVGFVDYVLTHKAPPPHAKNAPPAFIPPEDAADSEIDRYIESLLELKAYEHPKVLMGPVGPVTIDEFRTLNIFHAAHHLGFLTPKRAVRRTELRYASTDDLRADIANLRKGYFATGTWSLPQICWHLEITIRFAMGPGPHAEDTDEQKARNAGVATVLATGQLPKLVAPDTICPPADAPDSAIDALLATLTAFDNFREPLAPHRLFGTLSDADRRALNLIHCAHHLSYLVPIDPSPKP